MNEIHPELILPSWLIKAMKATQQNPLYHAEGNVWEHTLLVFKAFEENHQKFGLSEAEIEVLAWAAILHDIGKPAVTKWTGERWTSHHHEEAGIPFARNILLDSKLAPDQQQQVLELIKYHSQPLSWKKKSTPQEAFRHLGIQTDLRLLGIFFYFDILGRNCIGKDSLLEYCEELNQEIFPRIIYEWGSYEQIQERYSRAPIQQKNALWNSLKFSDTNLTGKLLQAPPPAPKVPEFQMYLTISIPNSRKADFLEQNYGYCEHFPLEELDLSSASAHQREKDLRQAKHFISVWGRVRKPILITGELTNEFTRRQVSEFCRSLGGELTYLYFEEKDPRFEDYALPKPANVLDVIHPWEAHRIEFIQP